MDATSMKSQYKNIFVASYKATQNTLSGIDHAKYWQLKRIENISEVANSCNLLFSQKVRIFFNSK
ncbi:unnamed protein product [Paramecium octaurelia]|uniref:Uncharacterized protein n=1 Tax=Paramecium octaurelia TaxID=43137 RepID=A0A8S1WM96_PAROT|nr:unnamed protein product [Paramecium octaurelia]